MRKTRQLQALACAATAVLGISGAAQAGLLVYEPFDYTAGQSITGQANTYSAQPETWLLAGTAASLHVVGSGSLSAPSPLPAEIGNMADLKKSGTSSAYDRLNLPNAFNGVTPKYGANSTLYYSLLLNVPSITGLTIPHSNLNANNDGLFAFNNSQGSQGTAPNSWNGELSIRLGSVAGTYNLGIRASTTPNNLGSTPGATYWTGDLNPGDTHFIVAQATLGANPGDATQDLNSIWLDPNPASFGLDELTRPAPDGSSIGANSTTSANDTMQSFMIGAGIATAGAAPADTYMDEIRVGETWADVTSQTAFTPEPAGLALLGLGALGLLRRRR